jgi:hypothetical protein
MRDPITIADLALLEQPLIDIIHRELVKVCGALALSRRGEKQKIRAIET